MIEPEITAYCIQTTTHHLVASALRMITGCSENNQHLTVWQTGMWQPTATPQAMSLATSYHCAPAVDGWVVVYPNDLHKIPFAASLSRQTRQITVGINGTKYEAWDRGHPIATPENLSTALLDGRYFRDYSIPPVLDWPKWIHLWHPNWRNPRL